MKIKFSTVSMTQLVIQLDLAVEDVLELAINDSLNLYVNVQAVESVDYYEVEGWSGEWCCLGAQPVKSTIKLPVDARLCSRIQLDGFVKTKKFYSHGGREGWKLGKEVTILSDSLFADFDELNKSLSSSKALRAELHGNAKPAYYRNKKIYSVVKEEIRKDPFVFCTKSSMKNESLKMVSTKIAEYLESHQKELFGSDKFIDVNRETLVDRILNRDGFDKRKIDRYVKKPD